CSMRKRPQRSSIPFGFVFSSSREHLAKLYRTIRAFCSRLRDGSLRPLLLRLSVRHVYGARRISYEKDELIVLCVVRNGAFYVKSFLDPYFALGAKHIVFLVNTSTDDTVALLRQDHRVTVLSTRCPYRKYETIMKKYLVNRFSQNRWNLFADIDEL